MPGSWQLDDILKVQGTSPSANSSKHSSNSGENRGDTEPARLFEVVQSKLTAWLGGKNSRNSFLPRRIKHWVGPNWWHRADGLSQHLNPHPTLILPNVQPARLDTLSNVADDTQTSTFPVIATDNV